MDGAMNETRPGEARRHVEQRIAEVARRQHAVATRAQLIACGLGRNAIRRRRADGRLRRLHRGVYAVGPVQPPLAAPMAAVLACGPDAAISHRSAAELHGFLDARSAAPVDVLVPWNSRRRPAGVNARRTRRLDPAEVSSREGVPVTTPLRTIVDLAGLATAAELERAVARAERAGLLDARDLDPLPSRYARRAGAARLRALLANVGGPRLTRSEAERRFLDLVRRARLPPPQANAVVAGFEVDFLWPDHRIAVEVDGYRFHGSRARFESDRRRSAQLASAGIQVIPLTWRQIVDDDVATAVQIGRALVHRSPGGPASRR